MKILQELSIHDLMTDSVVTLTTEDTVDQVAAIFEKNDFHHIPILNRDEEVVGMISRTDLECISAGMSNFTNTQKESYNHALHRSLRTVDIMSKDVITLDAGDSVQSIYTIFRLNRIRAIPIVRKKKLLGLVTPFDLIEGLVVKSCLRSPSSS